MVEFFKITTNRKTGYESIAGRGRDA